VLSSTDTGFFLSTGAGITVAGFEISLKWVTK